MMPPTTPYPPSPVIARLTIEPEPQSIGHGDNWPVTWGDDGRLYAAYCDGKGFDEQAPWLSNGLAVITDTPPHHHGKNLDAATVSVPMLSDSGEPVGGGREGRKGCGLLMVESVLYLWVRNLEKDGSGSILAWSEDRGRSWTWSPWDVPHIGYPVWLNAGCNYDGARDDYAYLYSPNGPSAYIAYDGMMLARAPIDRIREREAYQFFAGLDENGRPRWTHDFSARANVFEDEGRCFRPGAVYIPQIGRHLLTMSAPGADWCSGRGRHLGVFDAPQPWGPWTTVAYIEEWQAPNNPFQPQIPACWVGDDGLSFYLLYSCHPEGPYQFNLQRCSATLW